MEDTGTQPPYLKVRILLSLGRTWPDPTRRTIPTQGGWSRWGDGIIEKHSIPSESGSSLLLVKGTDGKKSKKLRLEGEIWNTLMTVRVDHNNLPENNLDSLLTRVTRRKTTIQPLVITTRVRRKTNHPPVLCSLEVNENIVTGPEEGEGTKRPGNMSLTNNSLGVPTELQHGPWNRHGLREILTW